MGNILGYFSMPHPPIIIPEVGNGEERKISNTSEACTKVADEIAALNPNTIILITPHGPMFSDAIAISHENTISGSLANFGCPEVHMELEIDTELTKKIMINAQTSMVPMISVNRKLLKAYKTEYTLDHGAIVPLYFIFKKLSKFKLVHITYGGLSNMELYKFGMDIKNAVNESNVNTVFIASGDLSHKLKNDGPYDYSPYGKKFDREIIELLKKGDVQGVFNMDEETIENAGECGLRSYYIMLGAMNGSNIKGELLSYEGPFGVGYAVMRFDLEKGMEDILPQLIRKKERTYLNMLKNQDPYVRLARESLTAYILTGKFADLSDYVTEEMKSTKRGVFVSLKKFGSLRGCIGTIFPATDSVAEEIIRNAVEAGLEDSRFNPVTSIELKDITISVDVLTEASKASIDELDPKIYGVIVRCGRKTGLLLPDLEGINDANEQIDIALKKAGIDPCDNYSIEKFQVIRHK
jgi:AmmeMemoRadiSam system protein A/AmmeMemoRadiSam system protein B